MVEKDSAVARPADLAVALCLLTRLPLPALPDAAFDRQASAVWAFPLVGLIVGGLAACAAALALALGLPVWLAAGLCLAVQIVLTGAMHEDGLADCADGFWGGTSPERRLEIMADSAIGTYGTLALILSVGLRWGGLAVVLPAGIWGVVALAVASRAGLPVVMAFLPRARPGGLSDSVGVPPTASVAVALALGLGFVLLLAGTCAAHIALAAAVALAVTAWIARAKIGGQTGDVLGAAQQVVEIAGLLTLASLL